MNFFGKKLKMKVRLHHILIIIIFILVLLMFIDMKGKKCESRENAEMARPKQVVSSRRTDRQKSPSQQQRQQRK
jgi:hypothetical protein